MTASKNELIIEGDKFNLVKCKDGFWLYDDTRGMNLAMRAETERAAFIEALEYYQERTAEVEAALKKIQQAADLFIQTIAPEESDDWN